MTENIKLFHGDCLEVMKDIPDKSVDMILCDLPYGTTECKWDKFVDNKTMWEHYNRILKECGNIILFASQPFTTKLIESNPKMFRYEIIWVKTRPTGFTNANYRPMKKHENILVFYKKLPTYNPQGLIKDGVKKITRTNKGNYHNNCDGTTSVRKYTNYPTTQLNYSNVFKEQLHPTQKPVELLEYLIKTYTNENEIVLDNCMGSGSTGVACMNTNRKFIGIELDEKYFGIAKERIENTYNQEQEQ